MTSVDRLGQHSDFFDYPRLATVAAVWQASRKIIFRVIVPQLERS